MGNAFADRQRYDRQNSAYHWSVDPKSDGQTETVNLKAVTKCGRFGWKARVLACREGRGTEEAKGLFEEILVAEDSKQQIQFSKAGLPFVPS